MSGGAVPAKRRDWRARVRPDEVAAIGVESLVSAESVALALGIDRSTIYRMAGKVGGIPCVAVGPGRLRFKPADVRAYIERHTLREVAASRVEKLLRGSVVAG